MLNVKLVILKFFLQKKSFLLFLKYDLNVSDCKIEKFIKMQIKNTYRIILHAYNSS